MSKKNRTFAPEIGQHKRSNNANYANYVNYNVQSSSATVFSI